MVRLLFPTLCDVFFLSAVNFGNPTDDFYDLIEFLITYGLGWYVIVLFEYRLADGMQWDSTTLPILGSVSKPTFECPPPGSTRGKVYVRITGNREEAESKMN